MADYTTIDAMLTAAMRGEYAPWYHAKGNDLDPEDNGATPKCFEEIWARIQFHGIAAALSKHCERLEDWPTAMLDQIKEEARLVALWEETHLICVSRLIEALSAHDIETVTMKGTALAYSVYEDPAVRRRGDTDLLIRHCDRKRAQIILRQFGWIKREGPHGLVFQETWLFDTGAHFVHELDLHWQPNDRPALQKVLRNAEFFAGAQSLPQIGETTNAAPPVLTLIQLALNQAWHQTHGFAVEGSKVEGGDRLIWARDYDLLARGFSKTDWSQLTEICEERNVGPIVAQALSTAQSAFATPIPADIRARLAKAPRDPTIVEYLATADPIAAFKTDLNSLPSLRGKTAFILAHAWPNRKHLLQKYPDLDHWPTLALQAKRIVQSIGRLTKRGKEP